MYPHEQSQQINSQISKLTLPNLTNILLFGNPSFTDNILDATIEYILSTQSQLNTSQISCNSIYDNKQSLSYRLASGHKPKY